MRRLALAGLLAVTAPLASINLAVAALGGAPNPLSLRYLEEKTAALGMFGSHLGDHLGETSCDADPTRQIMRAATRHGVPVELALAVGRAESGHRPHRVSAAGAMGLMQLMPATARDLRVSDPFDQAESIDGGVRYLAWLLERYDGDRARAVAAYNAGPGVVPKRGPMRLPAETRAYVAEVERLSRDYVRTE